MKKRKELDALVSNGKIGSSKRIICGKKGSGSCSAHELLRHDSDSSDMEDFSILQPRRKGRKKHRNRLCMTSVCLSLCQFILVTTSCLVSGALVWLHLGLREDIDLLRAHIQKVEAGNRNTPEALHVIHSNLKQLDSNVTNLFLEVRKNTAEIENITSEVKNLKETTASLKASIAAAPAIQQLPKDMKSLSESVANFGSKMNALESNIKEIKDQQSNMQTTAQNLSGELDGIKVTLQDLSNFTEIQAKSTRDAKIPETNLQVDNLKEQLLNVVNSVEKINATCNSQLNANYNVPDVKTLQEAVMFLTNSTQSYESRLSALESLLLSNISFRIEQLESERLHLFKKPEVNDAEGYLNKTISETIVHLINKNIFKSDATTEDESNLQSLEQTHDLLVLLATLLQKFEHIPKSYILSHKNATELVENMLLHLFEEILLPRDTKIEAIEHELHSISSCIPKCHSQASQQSKSDPPKEEATTPVSLPSTFNPDALLKHNTQAQLINALE
ncbi:hypothetical protein JTE90_018104 [Oedothorax gibbosus]|uniref:Uncharacterized protein n=1 Tax=Oedothorax gibbosus TaxID=931172 RepID=A0AAV6UG97_9ARAC|nr:hypothetical protein JTE90_018104 [Oedothorax gibbosus]